MLKTLPNLIPLIFYYTEANLTNVRISPKKLLLNLLFLKNYTLLRYNSLIFITSIDFTNQRQRFEISYHFLSHLYNARLIVRLNIDEKYFLISICSLFPSANWWEREIWDLFGIVFKTHPDFRRILTDYGFRGYPLRKTFPTSGFLELRYSDLLKRLVYTPFEMLQLTRFNQSGTPWNFIK